jgi:Flp pilus assembly protein TadG
MGTSFDRGRLTNKRGSVLITMALWLMALMAVAALAVDIGLMYSHRQALQNIADAGALAGADALRGPGGTDPTVVKAAVQAAVQANSAVGESVIVADSDIIVGAWDAATKTVVPWDPTQTDPAVQVTVNRTTGSASGPETTILAGIMGYPTVDVHATAIAGVYATGTFRDPVELMIVQDASSSFQTAWGSAVAANGALINRVNGLSIQNDSTGFVAFNAALSANYLRGSIPSLLTPYTVTYPQMNQGIKYSTTTSGAPTLVDVSGNAVAAPSGQVRPLASPPVQYSTSHVLPTALTQLYGTASSSYQNGLIYKGNAWGDTDTSAGLKYAIDQWYTPSGSLQPGVSAVTRKVIVLVSDGEPHSVDGTAATNTLKNNAIAQATRAGGPPGGPGHGLGIVIHTITLAGSNGVDYAFNESLVRNGGYSFRAADASALADAIGVLPNLIYGKPHLLK